VGPPANESLDQTEQKCLNQADWQMDNST